MSHVTKLTLKYIQKNILQNFLQNFLQYKTIPSPENTLFQNPITFPFDVPYFSTEINFPTPSPENQSNVLKSRWIQRIQFHSIPTTDKAAIESSPFSPQDVATEPIRRSLNSLEI